MNDDGVVAFQRSESNEGGGALNRRVLRFVVCWLFAVVRAPWAGGEGGSQKISTSMPNVIF